MRAPSHSLRCGLLISRPCRGSRKESHWSEQKFQSQLGLPRVADALPQEAIKVEEPGCGERVHIVVIVEGIEQLEARGQFIPLAEFKGTGQAPVEGEILVVL